MNPESRRGVDAEEGAVIARVRSRIYGLLAVVYLKRPSDFLSSPDFRTDLETLNVAFSSRFVPPTQVEEGFACTRSYLATHAGDIEATLAGLGVDFTTFFRGVKRGYGPPPPYESVFVEVPGLVMGETTQQVSNCYRNAGLKLPEGCEHEPPDHISFELDFMRFLCEKESEEYQRGNLAAAVRRLSEESAFLRQHLLLWGPAFCDVVLSNATSDFYRGFAQLTRGFLTFDSSYLDGFLGKLTRSDLQKTARRTA